MKPLIVLLTVFVISLSATKTFSSTYNFTLSARISMAAMLCFTAVGHFVYTQGMSMMIPPFVPFKISVVYLTGILEIILAFGLLIPRLQVLSGWVLIVFLALMLPGNVYAAMHHVNFQKGTFDGPGLTYLWFRIPLQLLFIAWTYLSTIKPSQIVTSTPAVH
ncbi:MAG: hypothetical protein R8G66_18175 [Cytophagales bacterium]|nr:hypothetical protein [Cytophagales bacterium]